MSAARAHARTERILVAALALALVAPGAASAAVPTTRTEMIVRAERGQAAVALREIRAAGGSVERLGLPGLFVASVPLAELSRLAAAPSIASLTENRSVDLASVDNAPAEKDLGQLVSVAKVIGADRYWAAGFTGQGVDVALIDSGVAPVRGLVTDDKVVHGPDLSFESQERELRYIDTFGHGTHMAGIIAGRDNGLGLNEVSAQVENRFTGIAPGARIVSLKVADAFGTTDVSQIIAAIGWTIRYGDRDGLNVRVMNLSFGTESDLSYIEDPLAYAVERAWRSGIVVVVSAGNRDDDAIGLSSPAYDPYIIAVGATVRGGTETRADDSVAAFSRRGNAQRSPDLVAPGRSILSLRVPGSFLDMEHPNARVGETPRLFLGSGTSQASAVVAGAAALIISQRPGISPDKLKGLLKASAYPLAGEPVTAQGAGLIDLNAAFDMSLNGIGAQGHPVAQGSGGLGASRGGQTLVRAGERLIGSRDIFGNWVGQAALARLLNGSAASTTELVDAGWINIGWDARSWTVADWDARSWTARSWTARSWTAGDWTARSWTSEGWDARSWTSDGWVARSWTGSDWEARSWTARSWTAETWVGDTWSSAGWGD